MKRKLEIFDYTWHIPHQYDMMYALRKDCNFYHCLNTKLQWDECIRKKPDNLKFVTCYEAGKYDLAILHIDQQTISEDYIKYLIYRQFDKIITDIPKIVINHGSPVFPERFYQLGQNLSEAEMENVCRRLIRFLVKDNEMVVNSYTSAKPQEWGFGTPIVHGINSEDWWDMPKEPRVFTSLSAHGLDAYYNRSVMFRTAEELLHKHGYVLHYARRNVDTARSPEDYKSFLGRSLLYLDTSFRTPMNRARTEAFLSGCCVVQVEGAHDLERWAKPGENIVIVPNDPEKIAAVVADLLENRYNEAVSIGKKGKEMAIKEFNPEKYRASWIKLMKKTIAEKKVMLPDN